MVTYDKLHHSRLEQKFCSDVQPTLHNCTCANNEFKLLILSVDKFKYITPTYIAGSNSQC